MASEHGWPDVKRKRIAWFVVAINTGMVTIVIGVNLSASRRAPT
jgi:hypothetical protein